MWKKMRLLIVEDEQDIAFMLKRELEKKEMFVDTVGSVPQAREMIERVNYDIIVSDLRLPGDNGIELAKCFPITRIIFMTGYIDEKERLEKEGYTRIKLLDKPINFDDLLHSLYKILDEYSEQFCSQVFSNVCKEIKKLKKEFVVIKKDNNRTDESLANLGSIYSGLSASYTHIYESIREFENKLTNRDRVFHDMNEITMIEVNNIKNKIDVLIKNGHSNGK